MRLPNTAHTSRPWRIHELTRDFRLEDVWALPTPGGPGDFPRLVRMITSGTPSQSSSRAARTLWAIRWKLGKLLGWDDPDAGLGSRVPALRDRLPADLRKTGPTFDALPFTSLYLTDDEYAAEIANRTVHGVLHLGWVPDGAGGHRGQLSVLVKPNGLLGTLYLAAIKPFRHLIVYPSMTREIGRNWLSTTAEGDQFVHPFRAAIESRDIDAAVALLSDDVIFRSPVVFKPYHGRDAVALILHAVSQVFEDFRYIREIGAPDSRDHALVFHARIGERDLEGCDFLHLDAHGSIDELVVMVRPLTAAHALADAMKARLAATST